MTFAQGKGKHLFIGAILVAAILLRLWGVKFGLPHIYHFDEHFYVATALKIGKGIFFNEPFAPVGLSNVLFLEYVIYFFYTLLSGGAVSTSAFEAIYTLEPGSFFLIARLTSVVLGGVTVWLVYQLGSIVPSRKVGLVAALFLAVDVLHVRDSHFGVPDIIMTFCVAAAVLLVLYSLKKENISFMVLGGLMAGIAVSMKWTALPIAVVVVAAGFFFPWEMEDHGGRSFFLTKPPLWLAAGAVAVGFIISAPQIIINPSPYIAEALGQAGSGGDGGFDWWQVDTLPGWLFYLKIMFFGNGLLLWLFGLAGTLWFSWKTIIDRDRDRFLLLIFPVLYFILMGSTRHYFARYALPLLPFWAIFAADLFVTLSRKLTGGRRERSILVWVALILVIAQPLVNALRSDWIMTRPDTRTEAKQWIETTIPAGAKIALEWETHTPPLSTPEEAALDAARYYEIEIIKGIGLAEKPLTWYQEEEFDYLVTTSFISEIPLLDKEDENRRGEFYELLAAEYDQVAEFRPADEDVPFIFDEIYGPLISQWARDRSGPVLKIYQTRN